MKIMKLLIMLFLIISLECHTVRTLIKRSKNLTSELANEEKKSLQGNMSILTEKFKELFGKAQESKIFNFIFGAVLKIISLMNGNAVMEVGKCIVGTVETFFTSYKPENINKTYQEIKQEVDAKVKDVESLKNDLDSKEENLDEVGEDTAQYELDTRKLDCKVRDKISEELKRENVDDPEIEASLVDGDDEIEEALEETSNANKKKTVTPKFIEISHKPKVLKILGRALKEKLDALKEKLKNVKNKIKKKLKEGIEIIAGNFTKLAIKVRALLDKPLVKTLLYFVECALPSILEIISGGVVGLLTAFTGANIFPLIKNGPKFIKMLIDGFKSLRAGFKETKSLQNKWMNYGKGVACIVMLIVLSALGMSPQ
jgi:hypothetical protein